MSETRLYMVAVASVDVRTNVPFKDYVYQMYAETPVDAATFGILQGVHDASMHIPKPEITCVAVRSGTTEGLAECKIELQAHWTTWWSLKHTNLLNTVPTFGPKH